MSVPEQVASPADEARQDHFDPRLGKRVLALSSFGVFVMSGLVLHIPARASRAPGATSEAAV